MSKLLTNDQNKVLVGSNGKAYAVRNLDVLKGSTSPVDFTAAAGKLLRLMRYGKCEQGGTPTPSAPVDIVCNNGAIKARRQSGLPLGYQMVEWIKPTGTIVITGFKTKSTQEIKTVFYRERSGASYLYSSDTNTSGTTNTTAYLTSGAGNWRWDGKSYSIAVSSGIQFTSIQNKNGVWLNGTKAGWYSGAGEFVSTNDLRLVSSENQTIRVYSMTVRESGTVTLDLVPVQRLSDSAYGFYDKVSGNFYTNAEATITAGDPIDDPIEIYTDGTPEVLTVSGKNLFDKSNLTRINAYIASTGTKWTAAATGYSIRIPCRPNTTYTARYNGSGTQTVLSFGSTNNDNVPQGTGYITITQAIRQNRPTIDTPVTLTTSATDKWLIVAYNVADPENADMADNLQIEQGSTATDYEPYVAPQTATVGNLFAVGDYKDDGEIISGLLTHKVGIKVFDGTESWTKGTLPSSNYYYGGDTALDSNAENELMCNQFAVGTRNVPSIGKICIRVSRNGFLIAPNDQTLDTAEKFKQFLAAQYAAGTPVIVIYPLAAETTENVTPQPLNTGAGTNTLTDTAEVSNPEYNLTYKI